MAFALSASPARLDDLRERPRVPGSPSSGCGHAGCHERMIDLSPGERALGGLIDAVHLRQADSLPALIGVAAARFGARDVGSCSSTTPSRR